MTNKSKKRWFNTVSNALDEAGLVWFMLFLAHYTFGTYIIVSVIQAVIVAFYIALVGLGVFHQGDTSKRLIGFLAVGVAIGVQGFFVLINPTYYA